MALTRHHRPATSQPQNQPRLNPSSPLGRVLDSAWLGNTAGGRDILRGIVAPPPSNVIVQARAGGLALVGTGTAGTNVAAPSLTVYPYVLIGYGVLANAASNWILAGLSASGGGYNCQVHNSATQISFLVRYNFGTTRTLSVTLPTAVGVPICAVVVVYSDTDYRLFVNGIQATGTASPGTLGTGLNRVIPPGGTLNGALYFSGFGQGRALTDADALAISASPDLIWRSFVRERLVPSAAAGGSHTLTAASSSEAGTSSTAAVTQVHALAGAPGTEAGTSSTAAVVQAHALAASSATEAGTSSTGAIGQAHALAGAASTEAGTSSTGAVALGGTVVLSAAASTEAGTSTAGAVSQAHALQAAGSTEAGTSPGAAVILAGTIVLAAAPCTEAGTSGAGSVGQLHRLVGAACTERGTSSAATLPGGAVQRIASIHMLLRQRTVAAGALMTRRTAFGFAARGVAFTWG